MDINRDALARQMKTKYGYSLIRAREVIDDFTEIIQDNMRAGNSVTIYGFGCFDILKRQRHVVPRTTGEMADVPAHFIPRFYPGRRMRESVKDWERTLGRELIDIPDAEPDDDEDEDG